MKIPKLGLYQNPYDGELVDVVHVIPFFGFVHLIQRDGGITILFPIKLLKKIYVFIGEV